MPGQKAKVTTLRATIIMATTQLFKNFYFGSFTIRVLATHFISNKQRNKIAHATNGNPFKNGDHNQRRNEKAKAMRRTKARDSKMANHEWLRTIDHNHEQHSKEGNINFTIKNFLYFWAIAFPLVFMSVIALYTFILIAYAVGALIYSTLFAILYLSIPLSLGSLLSWYTEIELLHRPTAFVFRFCRLRIYQAFYVLFATLRKFSTRMTYPLHGFILDALVNVDSIKEYVVTLSKTASPATAFRFHMYAVYATIQLKHSSSRVPFKEFRNRHLASAIAAHYDKCPNDPETFILMNRAVFEPELMRDIVMSLKATNGTAVFDSLFYSENYFTLPGLVISYTELAEGFYVTEAHVLMHRIVGGANMCEHCQIGFQTSVLLEMHKKRGKCTPPREREENAIKKNFSGPSKAQNYEKAKPYMGLMDEEDLKHVRPKDKRSFQPMHAKDPNNPALREEPGRKEADKEHEKNLKITLTTEPIDDEPEIHAAYFYNGAPANYDEALQAQHFIDVPTFRFGDLIDILTTITLMYIPWLFIYGYDKWVDVFWHGSLPLLVLGLDKMGKPLGPQIWKVTYSLPRTMPMLRHLAIDPKTVWDDRPQPLTNGIITTASKIHNHPLFTWRTASLWNEFKADRLTDDSRITLYLMVVVETKEDVAVEHSLLAGALSAKVMPLASIYHPQELASRVQRFLSNTAYSNSSGEKQSVQNVERMVTLKATSIVNKTTTPQGFHLRAPTALSF